MNLEPLDASCPPVTRSAALVSNRKDLDVVGAFAIDDEVWESPDWQPTRATPNSDELDGAADTWVLPDHPEDLLDLSPEFVTKAYALLLIPRDRGSKLSLGF